MAKQQFRSGGRDAGGRGGRNARGDQRKGGFGPGKSEKAAARRAGQSGPAGRGGRPGSRPGGRPTQGGRPRRRDTAPMGDAIEGRRAVFEAFEAGIPLRSALVDDSSGERDATLEQLVARLEAAGVPVERVPRQRLDKISSHGAHQGIVVRTKPFEYASVSQIIREAGEGDALVVVLDHVTDEGNFGAIVRTAEVVGAAGVIIANARAASVGPGAYKTSAGAVLHIPIAQVPNLGRALDDLKAAGFWAAAATEHAEQDVWHAPMHGRLALVMGSEGDGISRLMLEKCDFSCRLPQRGRVESLNVAQATTVLCYEWLRRECELEEGVERD